MNFKSLYENLDLKLSQYFVANNILEVPFINQDPVQEIFENEFVLRKKPFNFYRILHTSSLLMSNILSLNEQSRLRFEDFLNNMGAIFINDGSNDFSLDTFNNNKDELKIFSGINVRGTEFVCFSFDKYNFQLHITEQGMSFSSHYKDLQTERRAFTENVNIDFNLALDEFIVLIEQLTGLSFDSAFKSKLSFLTTEHRINSLLASKQITAVKYIDKNDILKLIENYEGRSNITVGVHELYFFKEDAKALLIILKQLFSNETYNTLVDIVTAVVNYQKSISSIDKLCISFPVKNIFYDITKSPFIKIYLNEKYQVGFSVNGYSFTNNAIVHHVPDYKRLPNVLATILEERSRVVDMKRLTAPLI